jgi:hypothetical protein
MLVVVDILSEALIEVVAFGLQGSDEMVVVSSRCPDAGIRNVD